MRTAFAYTSARILMFGCSVILLYVAGARGILLLGLGLVISALGSYILLNKQRQVIADKLNRRLGRVGARASQFRSRLEEGASAEDEDEDEDEDEEASGVAEAPETSGEPEPPRAQAPRTEARRTEARRTGAPRA